RDGGRTWTLPQGRPPRGYRSAVVALPGSSKPTFIAVGPTGSDATTDDGQTWTPLADSGFHAVGFAGADAGWAVGEDGVIARFDPTQAPGLSWLRGTILGPRDSWTPTDPPDLTWNGDPGRRGGPLSACVPRSVWGDESPLPRPLYPLSCCR